MPATPLRRSPAGRYRHQQATVQSGMRWHVRFGLALLTIVAGALTGWLLSLTQGSHGHHWPWVVVGGVVALALGLIAAEFLSRRRNDARQAEMSDAGQRHPGVFIAARQLDNRPGGQILASGPGQRIDILSEDFINSGVIHADQDQSDTEQ